MSRHTPHNDMLYEFFLHYLYFSFFLLLNFSIRILPHLCYLVNVYKTRAFQFQAISSQIKKNFKRQWCLFIKRLLCRAYYALSRIHYLFFCSANERDISLWKVKALDVLSIPPILFHFLHFIYHYIKSTHIFAYTLRLLTFADQNTLLDTVRRNLT